MKMTLHVPLGYVVPEYHDAFVLKKREQGLNDIFLYEKISVRCWAFLEPIIKVSPELRTDIKCAHS